MQLHFGLSLDDAFFRHEVPPYGGIFYAGPKKLLQHLEDYLGLSGTLPVDEYLRVEQYRQVIEADLKAQQNRFYSASYAADAFATAQQVLQWRDELLLSGWDFTPMEDMPERLATIAALEKRLRELPKPLCQGLADRWHQVCLAIPQRKQPFTHIVIQDPARITPRIITRIFGLLSAQGVLVTYAREATPLQDNSDLANFQRVVFSGADDITSLKGDGSLLIVRSNSDTELAAWTGALLKKNPAFQPVFVLANQAKSLDQALVTAGLPAFGLSSLSAARPALQMLKLAPVFLWNPIDPAKIMEFVSLSVKPIHEELAAVIAACLAEKPGLHNQLWEQSIADFLADKNDEAITQQYENWFNRPRFDFYDRAPKAEAKALFQQMLAWAQQSPDEHIRILQEQTEQIIALLDEFQESRISALELERIIRTVLQAAPIQLSVKELGGYAHVAATGAFTQPADDVVWWNFIQHDPDYFFSTWYREELDWLADRKLFPEEPAQVNDRLIWQRKQPILAARKRLLLLIPHAVHAKETHPHPLLGDLAAAFDNLDSITYTLQSAIPPPFSSQYAMPAFEQLAHRRLPEPRPFIQLQPDRKLQAREEESYSSLESLLYYPHIWVFRYQIKLRKSPILSVKAHHTLLGNLAHAFFERLLKSVDIRKTTREEIEAWFDQHAPDFLAKEGASLLLYGREQERTQFIRKLKIAAWSFVSTLRSNQWQVLDIELPLEGTIQGLHLKGRADIVLARGQERAVVDLKWKRVPQLVDTIKNQEDLQLVIYAGLLPQQPSWAHTAFFSIEQARFVARNNAAFAELAPILPDADHADVNEAILNRIMHTYQWRMQQIRQGQIETRCKETAAELERQYEGEVLHLLEMKTTDQYYDDYPVLIHRFR
jgi:ATP-dependent helicase/nuclease subunit B